MLINSLWPNKVKEVAGGGDIISGEAKYLAIPANSALSTIPAGMINDFPDLEELYIPATVGSMNKKAIQNCPKLAKIVVAKKSKKLKNYPWGAPATCEIVWDVSAQPKQEDTAPDVIEEFQPSPVIVPQTTSTPEPENYRHAMLKLIQDIRDYANKRNYAGFQLINNGGVAIFAADSSHDWTEEHTAALGQTVDAVAVEDVFYGTNKNWDIADDQETPAEYTQDFINYMEIAKKLGARPIVIDYCSTPTKIAKSFEECAKLGYGDFVATDRDLTTIPDYSFEHNTKPCYSMNDIQNFLVLLNGEKFVTKDNYLNSLAKTWYDCLIIDLEFNSQPLQWKDIKRLRYKPDGTRRLIVAYLSLGEAEVYRSYWDEEWSNYKPDSDDKSSPNYLAWKSAVSNCDWISGPNKDWAGNFKVKYWTDEWKKVLFGTDNSTIDLIMRANFDGIFMDVIDAYEYFENKKK